MTFIPASLGSLVAFYGVLLSVVAMVGWAAYRAGGVGAVGRTLLGLGVWLAGVSAAVSSGWAESEPMPRLLMLLGMSNVLAVAFALSPLGGKIARSVPLSALVAFQGFRLPLELVLHSWAEQGTIPETMSWNGSNLDILSGILALVCAPLAATSRGAAWIANLVGLTLLLNVARVAVMSSPLPFAWGLDRPLLLAFHLPYVWIVPVCVAGALAGHVILTRALLRHEPAK